MPNASIMGDTVQHDNPHCHAPVHPPPGPGPTIPLPGMPTPPLKLVSATASTVMITSKPACIMQTQTTPCILPPPCIPAGPGSVMKASTTVMICNLPAARVNDIIMFDKCAAGPIPGPTGKIVGPGAPTVQIGG